MVNAEEFISVVFDGAEGVMLCRGVKVTSMASERLIAEVEKERGEWYVPVATSGGRVKENGMVSRQREDLADIYLLVCDDIGSKCSEPPVAPSYKLETSEGNYQWGYLLEPVSVAESGKQYEALVAGVAARGWSDAGAGGSYRLVRLPGSVNVKEGRGRFVSRIVEWEPSRVWSLEELASDMDVPLVRRIGGGSDEVLEWLKPLVVGSPEAEWVEIPCPWAGEEGAHSTGETAYYNAKSRAFKCHHSHAVEPTTVDFLDWVASEGGPGVVRTMRAADLPDVRYTAEGAVASRQLYTPANLAWVLKQMGVSCRLNMMTCRPEVTSALDLPEALLCFEIRGELTKLGITASEAVVKDVFERCQLDRYHPMEDWLDALPAWDGVDRIAQLEATVVTDTPAWPFYLRRWLLQVEAGVRGWRQNGLQLPHVLVLSGDHGLGKSTWLKNLVPAEFFFGEAKLHLNGADAKDHKIAALEAAVTELSEIETTFGKSAMGALKSFISTEFDVIRRPYDRFPIRSPRTTTFCGSVNTHEFLVDQTGNRRFWPVAVTKIHRMRIDLEQLWAQVVALDEEYWLTEEEELIHKQVSEEHRQVGSMEEEFLDYFTPTLMSSSKERWVAATTTEIFNVLGTPDSVRRHPVHKAEMSRLLRETFGKARRVGGKRKAFEIPVRDQDRSIVKPPLTEV